MHPTLAGFYPFLLGSPARCAFLSYLCLYICLGSPARSRLSRSAVALTIRGTCLPYHPGLFHIPEEGFLYRTSLPYLLQLVLCLIWIPLSRQVGFRILQHRLQGNHFSPHGRNKGRDSSILLHPSQYNWDVPGTPTTGRGAAWPLVTTTGWQSSILLQSTTDPL